MQPRKILVVDDEFMVADVIRKVLSAFGHQVYCSPNGEHAVEETMEHRYDLALIDAMLPGMNGFETFAALQLNCPQIKGILVSGDLSPEMIFAAMEQGFSATLEKPVQPEDLKQALAGALGESLLAEENLRLQNKVKKMRALLEQYIAPEVASLVLNRRDGASGCLGGVRELTILFADIRHFTFLVEQLPLPDVQLFLTDFFDMIADIIAARRGTLDKFIGDAALAVFGAPVDLQEPVLAAVSAAQDIQIGFSRLKKVWRRKSELFEQIGLGIGISHGEVFWGNVGSRRRIDFTVIGQDVNIAQRLASETVSGQILVTEVVQQKIAGSVDTQEEKECCLRGIAKKMQLYSIVPQFSEDAS